MLKHISLKQRYLLINTSTTVLIFCVWNCFAHITGWIQTCHVYSRPSIPRKLDTSDLGPFPPYLALGSPCAGICWTSDRRIQIRYLGSKSYKLAKGIPRYTVEPLLILDTPDLSKVKGGYFSFTSYRSEVNVLPFHSHWIPLVESEITTSDPSKPRIEAPCHRNFEVQRDNL